MSKKISDEELVLLMQKMLKNQRKRTIQLNKEAYKASKKLKIKDSNKEENKEEK